MKLPVFFIITKYKIPILITTCVVVFLGSYAAWSYYAWNDYHSTYQGWQNQMKRQFDEALILPGKSREEQHAKLQAFEQIASRIASQDSICKTPYLIAWQRIIPTFGDDEKKCEEVKANVYALNEKLTSVIMYLKNERTLGATLEPIAKQAAEQSEKSWESQAALWRDIDIKVERLSVHTAFAPTKQAAREVIKQIDTVWQEVMAAHKAQDKSKYEAAKTRLIQAYGGLGRISDVSSKQLTNLYRALALAYKKI